MGNKVEKRLNKIVGQGCGILTTSLFILKVYLELLSMWCLFSRSGRIGCKMVISIGTGFYSDTDYYVPLGVLSKPKHYIYK